MGTLRVASAAVVAIAAFALASRRAPASPTTGDAAAPEDAVEGTAPLPAHADVPLPTPEPSPYDEDAAMAAHAEPVASYTLRAKLDTAAHTLHGEGEIVWKNATSEPTEELWLHLYLNAFKNERTVFLRAPVYGFRGSGTPPGWGWIQLKKLHVREMDADVLAQAEKHSPDEPDDETDLRVPLPRAVPPGESITLDVAWDEKLPSVLLRTGYLDSFHMVAQWFPKIARREPDGEWRHFAFDHLSEFYSDFGTYDVTVDVPEAFEVGACGKLTEEKKEGGRAIRRYVQADVHDFAFTAWDQFKVRETKHDGIAIRLLYPPGHERAADVQIADVEFALDRFGKAYGRYPYEQLTIVHPPPGADEAGGMEYPTLITTGGAAWLPYSGVKVVETVAVHELGHQWFYGLVATDEHLWPFLDEGVNSYAELDAMEARYPGRSAGAVPGLAIGMPGIYRVLASEAEQNAPVAQPTTAFATGGDYGALVYERTATILLTLGRVYGDDVVRRAVGRYARKGRFGHPTPDDLVAAFRETMGEEVADALYAALFERATVDYVVEGFTSHADDPPKGIFGDPEHPADAPAGDPGGWRGEVLVRRRGALAFPVEIELVAEDGSKQRIPWDAKAPNARIPYVGRSELMGAVIDPDHRVLLDDNLANNARRVGPRRVSPRVLERVWFAGEVALSAVLP